MSDTQESRTSVVSFRVTPSERRRLDLVATVEGSDLAALVLDALRPVIARGDEYAARVEVLRSETDGQRRTA